MRILIMTPLEIVSALVGVLLYECASFEMPLACFHICYQAWLSNIQCLTP